MLMATTELPRILCVDDEPYMLSALSRQMRTKFNIATAGSAKEGLDLIRNDGPFDVVISDFRMPEMNGAEFLSLVKEIDPTATLILLTGQASIEGLQSVVNDSQVYKILFKPCSPEDLHEAVYSGIQKHLDKKTTNEQLDELLKSLVP